MRTDIYYLQSNFKDCQAIFHKECGCFGLSGIHKNY